MDQQLNYIDDDRRSIYQRLGDDNILVIAIKSIKNINISSLSELINNIQNIQKNTSHTSIMEKRAWELGLSVFCKDISEKILKYLYDLHMSELQNINTHIKYYEKSLDMSKSLYHSKTVLKNGFNGINTLDVIFPNHKYDNPNNPNHYTWQDNLFYYFNKGYKYRTLNYQKLIKLKRLQHDYALWVGRLYRRINKIQKITSYNDGVSSFSDCVESLYVNSTSYNPSMTPNKLLEVLKQSLIDMKEIKSTFYERLKLYKRPSKYSQYWFTYSIYTSLSIYLLYQSIMNHNHIYNQMKLHSKSLYNYTTENIIDPIKDMYNSIFNTFQNRSTMNTMANSLKKSQNDLTNMLEEFAMIEKEDIARIEHIDANDLNVSLRAKQGDMSLVMGKYQEQIKEPFKSLRSGTLAQSIAIQIQKAKVNSEEIMTSLDQLLKANEINFQALIVIPATGIVYGIFYTIYRIITIKSNKNRNYKGLYKQIGLYISALNHLISVEKYKINLYNQQQVISTNLSSSEKTFHIQQLNDNNNNIDNNIKNISLNEIEIENDQDTSLGYILLYISQLVKLVKMLPKKIK